MKKLFYTTLIAITFGLLQNVKAQINLLHTFQGSVRFGVYTEGLEFLGINHYVVQDRTTGQIRLYNEDFSLYRTITIAPPPGQTGMSWAMGFSRGIFTDDDRISFVVSFHNSGAGQNLGHIYVIYDEDGAIVKKFEPSHEGDGWFLHATSDGQLRMVVRHGFVNAGVWSIVSKVYSLPGTVPATPSVAALQDSIKKLSTKNTQLIGDTTRLYALVAALNLEIKDLNDSIKTLLQLLADCESSGTSIANLIPQKHIQIFPNPVSYELRIVNYDFSQGDIVELFDMNGRRVYSARANSQIGTFTIDMSNFQSGNYILRIGNRIAKVVKQ